MTPNGKKSQNVITWESFPNGVHSTKVAFKWITKEPSIHSTSAEIWIWVWHVKVLEKIKHFIWLAFHGKLPTNLVWFMRHLLLIILLQVWCFSGLLHDYSYNK